MGVGIIIFAVASALLGLYVFDPDGGLRMFNSLTSIWQSIMGNAPVILHPPFFGREMIEAGPFRPFRYVNDEDIMECLQLLSKILGPVIGPPVPPRVEHPIPPLPLRFLRAAIDAISGVWPYLMLMSFLANFTLATLQKFRDEEKRDVAKQLEQTNKKYLDMTEAKGEQADAILILDDKLKQVTMDMKKPNEEKDKKIVELSDSLEQLKNEHLRVTQAHSELGSLLGEKTEAYLHIKKAHDDLSDSLGQGNQKPLGMTQAHDQNTQRHAVLDDQLKKKIKELQDAQKFSNDLEVKLDKKTLHYADMITAKEERAKKVLELESENKGFKELNTDILADNSMIRSEKNDLEIELKSVKNDLEKCKTDHKAAVTQIEGENKKLKEDTQNQRERFLEESKQVKGLLEEKTKLLKQFDEKSRQMKQLEEDQKKEQKEREETSKQVEQQLKEDMTNQLKLLEGMGKELKQSKDDAKEQEKKAEDREKQRQKAEEELKMLQPKLQDLQTANVNLKESVDKSKGQEKKQREEIDELKGQLKGCEERNTSLEREHSKSKSAGGGLEDERNSLLEEVKKRDADLKQLQTRCDRIEKERDTALDEASAQKEARREFQEMEKQRLVEEAKNREEEEEEEEEEKAMVDGLSSIIITRTEEEEEEEEEGTGKPHLITADGGGGGDDDAAENEENANMPKIRKGKKKRRRRHKHMDSAQSSSPTKTEPDSPLKQFVTAAERAIAEAEAEAEKDPAPVDGTLPSGASTNKDNIEDEVEVEVEVEDDAASDPDDEGGPSELPDNNNIGSSPTKHRRPGRRNSKRDHKFETEKRKREQGERMVEGGGSTEVRLAPEAPEAPKEGGD